MSEQQKSNLIEVRHDEKSVMKISEMARNILKAEHNVDVRRADVLPTIVKVFLDCSVSFLNTEKSVGNDVKVNILDSVTLGITHRDNEDAEKEGNFVPYALPGIDFKMMVKDDGETEE